MGVSEAPGPAAHAAFGPTPNVGAAPLSTTRPRNFNDQRRGGLEKCVEAPKIECACRVPAAVKPTPLDSRLPISPKNQALRGP